MTDDAALKAARFEVAGMFKVLGAVREVEAVATGDRRLMASALNIQHLATTVDQVSDDVVSAIASLSAMDFRFAETIAERCSQIGLELPMYVSASEFFQPIMPLVDAVLADARKHLQ